MFAFNKEIVNIKGQEVEIVELSAANRNEVVRLYNKDDNVTVYMIEATVIKMGCTQAKELSVQEIMDWPSDAFNEVYKAIMRLSGLEETPEGDDLKKD